MVGGFPILAEIGSGVQAETATSLWGITISGGGLANVQGAWTTVIASTPAEASWLDVTVMSGGQPARCAIDIGVGSAGNEVALIRDLLFMPANNYFLSTKGPFPLAIPAGQRLVARYRSDYNGVDNCALQVGLYPASFSTSSFAGVDSIGFIASTTSGTSVPAGNQTMGSYTQIIASTLRDYSGIFVIHDSLNRTASDQGGFDISIGASGSEQVIIPHLGWTTNSNDISSGWIYPINIPAGTRIAARSYFMHAGDTSPTIIIYGIYQ